MRTADARTAGTRRVPAGVGTRGVAAGLVAATVVLAALCLVSLMVGARPLSPDVVLSALVTHGDTEAHTIVMDARLPRTALGLAAGAALGACGALIQAYTRNPLADPGILGVNAGSTFAVVVAVGVLGITSPLGFVWFAFGGALAVTALVYVIGTAGRGGASPTRMTLTGVALGAVLTGLGSIVMLKNIQVFSSLRYWGMGSLGGRNLETLATVAPFIVLGLVIAVSAAGSLNAIALGDDLGSSLGANVRRTRILTIVAITLLAGGATAIAGPIAFVGLMVPHAVRWVTGPDQRWIIAYSIILAPALLLTADVIGRIVLPTGELAVGIVTALLGAPVLVLLARRRKVSGL